LIWNPSLIYKYWNLNVKSLDYEKSIIRYKLQSKSINPPQPTDNQLSKII